MRKKHLALIGAALGVVIIICGLVVYLKLVNAPPSFNVVPTPELVITEQIEPSQDKDIYFEPDNEPVVIEEPVIDWEEPPVTTVYNPDADLNGDGHVDRGEWEIWVVENPADLNQDLYIEDWELEEYNNSINQENKIEVEVPSEIKEDTPIVNNKPNNENTKPVDKPTPPATNNNGMTQKEVDNAKQMSEDAINDLLNWGSDNGKTQEEIDAFNENQKKGYDWN